MKINIFFLMFFLSMNSIAAQVNILPSANPPPQPIEDRPIYKVVEQMPIFSNCELEVTHDDKRNCTEKAVNNFIKDNLIYPDNARNNKIEGTCVVQFIIGLDGLLYDIKVVKDIGYGCGEAAHAVITKMNEVKDRWTPGKQRGKVVDVLITQKVNFKL